MRLAMPAVTLPARLVALVAGLVAALLLTSSVAAHVEYQGSEPPADAVVTVAPTEVIVQFTGELGDGSTVQVTNAEGTPVDNRDGAIDLNNLDRNTVRATLQPNLPDGTYIVDYTAVPTDGHEPATGAYTFTIAAGGVAPALATPGATPGATPVATPGATPVATPVSVADASTSSGPLGNGWSGIGLVVIVLASLLTLGLLVFVTRRAAARG